MAIEFTLAQEVAAGDALSSAQLVSLANAFNDRVCSGIADPTERVFFYVWSIFNQVRNRFGYLHASKAEFFEAYQMVHPDQGEWPVGAAPGEEAGANLETPINAFVFGNAPVDLEDEPDRLALRGLAGASLTTPGGIWGSAKVQRGLIEVDGSLGSVALNAPALENGWEFYKIAHNPWSPHGNSYGGFMPGPRELISSTSYCSDQMGAYSNPLYEYFFTNVITGHVAFYCGPCSGSAANWHGHSGATLMQSIHLTPFAYHVLKQDGTYDILQLKEWMEGPYENCGILQKRSGAMLSRVLNAWMAEFRGSDAQYLASTSEHLQHAFDFERYLSSQNQMAPNIAQEVGGVLIAIYPIFALTGPASHPENTLLDYSGGGKIHQFAPLFSIGGAHILCTKLLHSCEIVFLNNGAEMKRVTATPDASGNYTSVTIFDYNESPNISVKIANQLDFVDATGYLSIECSELLTNKPSLLDAYVLLRLGSAGIGSGIAEVEGVGINVDTAKTIGDDYFEYGCIINRQNQPGIQDVHDAVSRNAIFDAARRFSQYTRCMNRAQFHSYLYDIFTGETSPTARLYFKRYKTVYGVEIDMFSGMFPIVKEATANGWTNEWVMHIYLKPYSTSESAWKIDAYSDWNPFVNRGLIKSTVLEAGIGPDGGQTASVMKRHYLYGQNEAMTVEAVSGYTYALGCNPNADIKFFKSCQVYKKPYYIDSIVPRTVNGVNYVRINLSTRLQHHDLSTSYFTNVTNLSYLYEPENPKFEDYRTDENGLLQYTQYPTRHADVKIGDLAHYHSDPGDGNAFHGAIIPHFIFTKLVPKPYIDPNATQDAADTRVTSDVMRQCELYLRAMCEGYVDDVIAENADPTKGACACLEASGAGGSIMYDWSFENLCYSAFGGRWVTMLPAVNAETMQWLRPDKPSGYGPLPNTGFYAEIYNQIVKAVNKLTCARVPLPMQLMGRHKYYRDVITKELQGNSALSQHIWKDIVINPITPADPILFPELATTAWVDYAMQQLTSVIWYTPIGPGGTTASIEIIKRVSEYKFTPINPDAKYACDESWREMVFPPTPTPPATGGPSDMGWVGKNSIYVFTGTVTTPPVNDAENANFYNPTGTSYYCNPDPSTPLEACKISGSGRFDVTDYGVLLPKYQFYYGTANGMGDTSLISNLVDDSTLTGGVGGGRRYFIFGTMYPIGVEGAFLAVPTAL